MPEIVNEITTKLTCGSDTLSLGGVYLINKENSLNLVGEDLDALCAIPICFSKDNNVSFAVMYLHKCDGVFVQTVDKNGLKLKTENNEGYIKTSILTVNDIINIFYELGNSELINVLIDNDISINACLAIFDKSDKSSYILKTNNINTNRVVNDLRRWPRKVLIKWATVQLNLSRDQLDILSSINERWKMIETAQEMATARFFKNESPYLPNAFDAAINEFSMAFTQTSGLKVDNHSRRCIRGTIATGALNSTRSLEEEMVRSIVPPSIRILHASHEFIDSPLDNRMTISCRGVSTSNNEIVDYLDLSKNMVGGYIVIKANIRTKSYQCYDVATVVDTKAQVFENTLCIICVSRDIYIHLLDPSINHKIMAQNILHKSIPRPAAYNDIADDDDDYYYDDDDAYEDDEDD